MLTLMIEVGNGLDRPTVGREQNIHHALSLADRGYVLENGRIVLEGTCAELSQNSHIRQHYLGL